jgi:uncharacterized protein YxjI
MKQEFWCLGDDFVIRDEQGNSCYQVDGSAFSFGHKLSFQDMEGREVATIRERLLSWGPSYEIGLSGQGITTVSKEHFTFFYCKFEIDGPGPQDYEADGDFLDHEYKIKGRDGIAAEITKRWFSLTDSYGIEVADDSNPVLMLATAVVIDLVCHDKHDNH